MSGWDNKRPPCLLAPVRWLPGLSLWMIVLSGGCVREPESVSSESRTPQPSQSDDPRIAWPPDDRRVDAYTGSDRCAECHEQIVHSYFSSHPMGRSVRMPDELHPAVYDTLPASFQVAGRRYAVQQTDSELVQSESITDPPGEIYRQGCRTDFAIGSGQRGHTFVINREGSLYQAPLTWYSERSRWDLSPGYDPQQHPRFERRISDGCLACHSGRPNRSADTRNRFETPIFHEASIGCERCHGPGSRHVNFHSNAESGITDSIVNPIRLDPMRRDSVCFQCHLHGHQRILRQRREEYDFRPGDRLSDVWVTFVQSTADRSSASRNAVSQVEQMLASRCYQGSNGRLGCISCHDPHQTPPEAERLRFYRRQCRTCHQSPDSDCALPQPQRLKTSASDSCIQCHMPSVDASDVPHTAQTDHRVLRRYDGVPLPGPASTELDVFDQEYLPQRAVQRAYGLLLAGTAGDSRRAAEALAALEPFLRESAVDTAVWAEASWLLLRLGDLTSAARLARRVIDLDPKHPSALEALTQVQQADGQYQQALDHLNELLRQAPLNSTFHLRKARILLALGRSQDAIDQLEHTLSINPLHSQARQLLIDTLQAAGSADEATLQLHLQQRLEQVQHEETRDHASQ